MKGSSLFTFILEYLGGTYISQVNADCIDEAVHLWAAGLNEEQIYQFGPKLKQRLVEELKNDKNEEFRLYRPVPLEGVENVWFLKVPIPGGSRTILNAVKTAKG